jgi:hypothetical protein
VNIRTNYCSLSTTPYHIHGKSLSLYAVHIGLDHLTFLANGMLAEMTEAENVLAELGVASCVLLFTMTRINIR